MFWLYFLSLCFSNIPRCKFTKSFFNGRLGFPGLLQKKAFDPFFQRCNLPSTIRAFFRCNHQQHRQRNSKTVNGKADICQQKGLRVEQLILLRQLVLMSSFAGCIHHKSHDAVVVSEDDGIVRQIGQTSPKLRKNSPKNPRLQFTRQAASTTRKPSTTCSNSMSHPKTNLRKKNG